MIYFIVLALVAILAVVAYNMYQESQYRKQVREQFGHSDKDALLGSKTDNVRDGRQASGGKGLMSRKAAKPQQNAAMRNLQEQDALFAARVAQAAATKPEVEIAVEDDFTDEPVTHTTIGLNNEMTTQTYLRPMPAARWLASTSWCKSNCRGSTRASTIWPTSP